MTMWSKSVSLLAVAAVAQVLLVGSPTHAQDTKSILFVPEQLPSTMDPIVSWLAEDQQHGYMIYDTLFGLDEDSNPRPQMVGDFSVSEDGRVHTMTLREGLKFHDGSPVEAADAVASIDRWAQRDIVGRKLLSLGMKTEAVNERTFTIATDVPTGLIHFALAKPATYGLFIMRSEDAATDPTKPVTTRVGSGPFKFVEAEYQPGVSVVYERNEDYIPREDPPSFLAGGKVVKVERVEFRRIADAATAAAALQTGEIDVLGAPPQDLMPQLIADPNISARSLDKGGFTLFMRFNHMQPPFNNQDVRRAVNLALSQKDYMQLIAGDDEWRECYSYFGCGNPYNFDVGMDRYKEKNLDEAKDLLQKSGYNEEPVVLLHPSDHPTLGPVAELAAYDLRQLGLNVEVKAMDWATMLGYRANKGSPAEGGWSAFVSWGYDIDTRLPTSNLFLSTACADATFFGWPCDEQIEKLRDAWALTSDRDEQARIAKEIQAAAADLVPHVLLGQFFRQVAWRNNIEGLLGTPVVTFWNVTKD